jgi:hypothetical protein
MIRNIDDAKTALKEILGMKDGKQQVISITNAIAKSIDPDARKFLSAARERILKLQTDIRTRSRGPATKSGLPAVSLGPSKRRVVKSAPSVPPEDSAPTPVKKAPVSPPTEDIAPQPVKKTPGVPPTEDIAPRPDKRRTLPIPRKSGTTRIHRAQTSARKALPSAPSPGPAEPSPAQPTAMKRLAPRTSRAARAKRRTEAFEIADLARDTEEIPLLPQDRILDEEFLLMFESLEAFVIQGVPVKAGPPPDRKKSELPTIKRKGRRTHDPAVRESPKPQASVKTTPPAKPPVPAAPEVTVPEPVGASPPTAPPERIDDSPLSGTHSFSRIREEIEEAGGPLADEEKGETREFRKENVDVALAEFEEIVSEIETSNVEERKYTGTRAFIRSGEKGNVLLFDPWDLHPQEKKDLMQAGEVPTKPEASITPEAPASEAVTELVPEEKPQTAPRAPEKTPVSDRPDVASEVMAGLKRKVKERGSSSEELARGAPSVEGPIPSTSGPVSGPATEEPKAVPKAAAPDKTPPSGPAPAKASQEPSPAPAFPAPIPPELLRCIEDFLRVMEKAGRTVPRSLLALTVAEDTAVVQDLVSRALLAIEKGEDLAFREAAGELYSTQMTWKVRFQRRLTRVERYLRTLLAGSVGRDIDPPVQPHEFQLILDTIFSSRPGIEIFSGFTVSTSEDKKAGLVVAQIVAFYREGQ